MTIGRSGGAAAGVLNEQPIATDAHTATIA